MSIHKANQDGDPGPPRSERARSFRGFLLGVFYWVVVPGTLFVCLWPVCAPATGDGHRRSSLSNVKQLAIANLMYASDYDERLPVSERWMDDLDLYTRNDIVFIDPDLVDPPEEGVYGFAFFEPLSGTDSSIVVDPDKVPLVFQSTLLHRNAASDLSTLPYPPRNEGGNAVAFMDSHARYKPLEWPETPIVLRFKPVLNEEEEGP